MTITTQTTDREWLPDSRLCPDWCVGDHAAVLAEVGDWDTAQEHRGKSVGHFIEPHHNVIDGRATVPGHQGWNMRPRQRPLEHGGFLDAATVQVEFMSGSDRGFDLYLPSGDARVLAAQLLAMADRLDGILGGAR